MGQLRNGGKQADCVFSEKDIQKPNPTSLAEATCLNRVYVKHFFDNLDSGMQRY